MSTKMFEVIQKQCFHYTVCPRKTHLFIFQMLIFKVVLIYVSNFGFKFKFRHCSYVVSSRLVGCSHNFNFIINIRETLCEWLNLKLSFSWTNSLDKHLRSPLACPAWCTSNRHLLIPGLSFLLSLSHLFLWVDDVSWRVSRENVKEVSILSW